MGLGVSTITRNLRDGQLVIKDGTGAPLTMTVTLDEGDLSWTEHRETLEIVDRNILDHTRPGRERPVDLQFSAKWTQLVGKSVASGNPLQLYEFLQALSGTGVLSTGQAGEQLTLQFEFTVTDPQSNNSELITFAKVFMLRMELNEREQANLIRFVGRDFETRPTISRP